MNIRSASHSFESIRYFTFWSYELSTKYAEGDCAYIYIIVDFICETIRLLNECNGSGTTSIWIVHINVSNISYIRMTIAASVYTSAAYTYIKCLISAAMRWCLRFMVRCSWLRPLQHYCSMAALYLAMLVVTTVHRLFKGGRLYVACLVVHRLFKGGQPTMLLIIAKTLWHR